MFLKWRGGPPEHLRRACFKSLNRPIQKVGRPQFHHLEKAGHPVSRKTQLLASRP